MSVFRNDSQESSTMMLKFPHIPEPLSLPSLNSDSVHQYSAHAQQHIFDLPLPHSLLSTPLSGTPSLSITPYSTTEAGILSEFLDSSTHSAESSPLFTPTDNFTTTLNSLGVPPRSSDGFLLTQSTLFKDMDRSLTPDLEDSGLRYSVYSDDTAISPSMSPSPDVRFQFAFDRRPRTELSINPANIINASTCDDNQEELLNDNNQEDDFDFKSHSFMKATQRHLFSSFIRDSSHLSSMMDTDIDEDTWNAAAAAASLSMVYNGESCSPVMRQLSLPPQQTSNSLSLSLPLPSVLPADHLTRDYSQNPYLISPSPSTTPFSIASSSSSSSIIKSSSIIRNSSAPPQILKCPHHLCEKTFARLTNLKAHLRSHSPTKPFDCTRCPRSFSRKHDLQRHMRVHTGDKPYVCACCKKSFARTDALKRHFRMEEICRESPEVKAMKRGRRYATAEMLERERYIATTSNGMDRLQTSSPTPIE